MSTNPEFNLFEALGLQIPEKKKAGEPGKEERPEPPDVAAHLFVYPGGRVRGWEITCPYCWEKHVHGAGSAWASKESCLGTLGHRLSHCRESRDNPGYELVESAGFNEEWRLCLQAEQGGRATMRGRRFG